jgi:hypothetical protein
VGGTVMADEIAGGDINRGNIAQVHINFVNQLERDQRRLHEMAEKTERGEYTEVELLTAQFTTFFERFVEDVRLRTATINLVQANADALVGIESAYGEVVEWIWGNDQAGAKTKMARQSIRLDLLTLLTILFMVADVLQWTLVILLARHTGF